MLRAAKGGNQKGYEAAETGSRPGTVEADRDLGSRSWEARHRVQNGWWRPVVIDACLVRRSKTKMRVENWVQRAV